MKQKIRKYIAFLLCMLLLTLSLAPTYGAGDMPLREKYTYGTGKAMPPEYYSTMKYPYYSSVLTAYEKNGFKPAKGSPVTIKPETVKLPGKSRPKTEFNIGGKSTLSFIWDDSIPQAEWEFEITSEGLYEIEMEYFMLPGSGNPAVRSLSVDSAVPFLEAGSIIFYRMWKDEGEPVVNSIGDEARPGQAEIPGWSVVRLCDSQGLYPEPFRIYFKPGRHSIGMEYVDQAMAVGNLSVTPYEPAPAYTDIKDQYKSKGYREASETVEIEAEKEAVFKSDPTIRRETDGDPLCRPASGVNRKLNVIGSWRWRRGNQAVTWKFNAPEDGLYKIGLRAAQWWNDGLPSHRQIAIDGKVPFRELEEYRFDYGRKWRTEVLGDASGRPYLFYLSKGEHTITMTVKMGAFTGIIHSLNEDALLLSNIVREIVKITGSNPDPNYDYELMENVPALKGDMEKLMASLQDKYEALKGMSDKLPAMANNFLTIQSQLQSMIKDPYSIARRMNDLNSAQSSLGAWYLSLQNQPLVIDYFMVGAPSAKWRNVQSNIFQTLLATFNSFLVSFIKDYDNVGSLIKDKESVKSVINVWVARGTEWAELIKEMADEEFTPKTGILVNINVLPASQLHAGNVNALMLSITSGRAPDVALGTDSNSPVEFAIRDAVCDLSKFKDFDAVSKRFIPNISIPYQYRGGVYALPETMDFNVMFYRKDMVPDMGIKLPDTREELYDHVLPLLYQNGLQFYYPAEFTQFIFQNGADFYTPDGMRSGLDTPEAYRAFRECAELFTNYGVPVVSNFFNRMRTGEMPMGIGNYNMYMQLSVAAPELAGRWGIAPLPGLKNQGGVVDRSNGALAGQCDVILKQSKHPEESWEFLKWWTSTPVQTRFARELEALIGAEARWNTANVEAFTSLSWNKADLDVIKEQWKWAKETPVVLGGYFTSRHLNNAWNRIVISGQPVRDALEEAVEAINKELRMKQEEYGVFDSQR